MKEGSVEGAGLDSNYYNRLDGKAGGWGLGWHLRKKIRGRSKKRCSKETARLGNQLDVGD